MKEKLVRSLGVFGYIIYYIIAAVLTFAPLVFLDFNIFVRIIIIAVVLFVPFIGEVTQLVVWIWSFVVVCSQPIDGFSIAYFVAAGVYVFTTVIPTAVLWVGMLFEKRYE